MTFKLTESHWEIAADEGREIADGGEYSRRRVRFVCGSNAFWFDVVDDFLQTSTPITVVRPVDRVRWSGGHTRETRHEYAGSPNDSRVEALAKMIASWISSGDLTRDGAERAAYHIFYVLEVVPTLLEQRSEHNNWMKLWCPCWLELLERAFGEYERLGGPRREPHR